MTITIRPFTDADLAVLQRANTPEMTSHLGGPETDEGILRRHRRYVQGWATGSDRMFVIDLDGTPVGDVGYWPREWQGEQVYESGWAVESEHQGRGIASAAVSLALQHAAREGDRRFLHAFPGVDNPASNSVCRRAGFTFVGETAFEYPPGNFDPSNDWIFDLDTLRS